MPRASVLCSWITKFNIFGRSLLFGIKTTTTETVLTFKWSLNAIVSAKKHLYIPAVHGDRGIS